MASKEKSQHFSTRVTALTYAQLDLMKDLQGLDSVSDLVRRYVMEGLARDSVDIEKKVEERLASERKRLQALAGQLADPSLADSEEGNNETDEPDEGDDMFTDTDYSAPLVIGTPAPASVEVGPASHDDLIPD